MVIRSMHTLAVVAVVLAVTACASGPASGRGPSPSPASPPATSPTPSQAPQITIGSPVADATVSVPFTVSGEANTFEAALTIEAVDGSGTGMCVRQLMATSGSGTPGTWEGTLAFPPEVRRPARHAAGVCAQREGRFDHRPGRGSDHDFARPTADHPHEPRVLPGVRPRRPHDGDRHRRTLRSRAHGRRARRIGDDRRHLAGDRGRVLRGVELQLVADAAESTSRPASTTWWPTA